MEVFLQLAHLVSAGVRSALTWMVLASRLGSSDDVADPVAVVFGAAVSVLVEGGVEAEHDQDEGVSFAVVSDDAAVGDERVDGMFEGVGYMPVVFVGGVVRSSVGVVGAAWGVVLAVVGWVCSVVSPWSVWMSASVAALAGVVAALADLVEMVDAVSIGVEEVAGAILIDGAAFSCEVFVYWFGHC